MDCFAVKLLAMTVSILVMVVWLNNRSVIAGLPRNRLFRWCVECLYLRMMT